MYAHCHKKNLRMLCTDYNFFFFQKLLIFFRVPDEKGAEIQVGPVHYKVDILFIHYKYIKTLNTTV